MFYWGKDVHLNIKEKWIQNNLIKIKKNIQAINWLLNKWNKRENDKTQPISINNWSANYNIDKGFKSKIWWFKITNSY